MRRPCQPVMDDRIATMLNKIIPAAATNNLRYLKGTQTLLSSFMANFVTQELREDVNSGGSDKVKYPNFIK